MKAVLRPTSVHLIILLRFALLWLYSKFLFIYKRIEIATFHFSPDQLNMELDHLLLWSFVRWFLKFDVHPSGAVFICNLQCLVKW